MNYRLELLETAEEDYEDSVSWYAERSNMAASGFIAAVEAALDTISENPHYGLNEISGFRSLVLKNYPFTVFYEVDEAAMLVIVVSIFHHSRDLSTRHK